VLKIAKSKVIYSMSSKNPPVAYIRPGEQMVFQTNDCYNNQIKDESTLWDMIEIKDSNPATGPLYVEKAEVGDILKISIVDIKIDDFGVMTSRPGVGVLGEFFNEYKSKIIPIENGKAIFNDKIEIPVNPMIGVIGVAPRKGEIKTVNPGVHGGNLDCKKIIKGSTLYLPVFHDGGLISIGDIHAIMADGEIVICGLEIGGEATVKIDVIKKKSLPLPMVVDDKTLSIIFSAKTIDQAAETVTKIAHAFLIEHLGMEIHEAGKILSLVGNLGICQIVNTLKTVRMEIPISIIENYGYKLQ
jgi:amidase